MQLDEVRSQVPGLKLVRDYIDSSLELRLLDWIDRQPWSDALKRRVQHYGYRYSYSKKTLNEGGSLGPLPELLFQLGEGLVRSGHMDRQSEQVIVNEYQPGQGISPHVDRPDQFGAVVCSLSLGAAIDMEFLKDTHKIALRLPARSLLVLADDARYLWRHAIRARRSDPGPEGRVPRARRVSCTFRTVIIS